MLFFQTTRPHQELERQPDDYGCLSRSRLPMTITATAHPGRRSGNRPVDARDRTVSRLRQERFPSLLALPSLTGNYWEVPGITSVFPVKAARLIVRRPVWDTAPSPWPATISVTDCPRSFSNQPPGSAARSTCSVTA